MKATIEVEDELYRQVKAKSALEGRAIREVTEALYRLYVQGRAGDDVAEEAPAADPESAPPWFAMLRSKIRGSKDHEMESIRRSIGKGIAREREL